MPSWILQHHGKRFVAALLLVSLLAIAFWTSSRYPSLNEKAMMGGSIQLEDSLSFEAFIPINTEWATWKRIIISTINWIHTNKQGMTFGVLFGAAFLTLLRYVRRPNFSGGFANSFAGVAVGTPLGVCVNCAAPIGQGLYKGGARAEMVLAAMLSSPSFNIVVLTMLFSIMPFYLAVSKIALSLIVILLFVPLICRFLPKEQLQLPADENGFCRADVRPMPPNGEHIGNSLLGFARDYLVDLWFIVRTTVPLMLLAGFLGTLVATLLPPDILQDAKISLPLLTATALIGTFMPVPIAFDVVVTGALLSGGLDIGYVMVLLFTLGIFSIYSFFIVAQAISLRAASLLGLVIVAVAVAAGYGADNYHKWQTKRALDALTSLPAQFSFIGTAHADPAPRVTVTAKPHTKRSPAGAKPFTRLEARAIGIDKPLEFQFKDMWPPFWEGRSIASGDLDNDGDPDLVLASTENGLYVYLNDGAGRFQRSPLDLGPLKALPIFNATPVDLNNDGWLDLFLTTYRKGNLIAWNRQGTFDVTQTTEVPNRTGAVLSISTAFGDLDRNGDIDVVLGNWTAGWYRRIPGEESRNRIVYNVGSRNGQPRSIDLPGLPGETLTTIISDINLDGHQDVIIGNDFELPDVFYLGQKDGTLKRIQRADSVVPFTTTTTMAIKNADLNNDLKPELYFAQIAGRSSGVSRTLKMQPIEKYCSAIQHADDRSTCQKNMDIKAWYRSGNRFDPTYAPNCQTLDPVYQAQCKAMLIKDIAIQNDDASLCDLISNKQQRARDYCTLHFLKRVPPTLAAMGTNIKQILRRNVLLTPTKDGRFEEIAEKANLGVGGWSWDVKIADFDNDGLQDVYIVNGTWVPNEVTPSNLYFSNQGGMSFKEASGPFGLEDYIITPAATRADIDGDGDLDIIAVTVNGPVVAFINNNQTGNAITFELRDHTGNRYGIGARIEISYGDGGKQQQMRELQLGGGFQSFDAPVVHFGLGAAKAVRQAVVRWPDGVVSTLDGPLKAGHTYRVVRR